MKLVQIKCNGEMDDLDIPSDFKNIKPLLNKSAEHKGAKQIQQLYSWEHDDGTIYCYSWTIGKAGKENKHELPPHAIKYNESLDESDTQLLFGDIFILMKKNKEYCDFDVSDYGLVYSLCFDGFDECLSEDDLTSEDEGGSCSDFIVDDNSLSNDEIDYEINSADEVVEYESIESIESIESSDSDGSDELDEDTNEY